MDPNSWCYTDSVVDSPAVKDPVPLAVAGQQPGLGQQLQMTRDAGLALAEDVDQFADRQFASGQELDETEPRRFTQRPERR